VLIYQPGGTLSQAYFPPGTVVTVASAAMWNSMTTVQFGQYDVLWVDGNDCGESTTIYTGLQATQATWGPAVRGRVTMMSDDADFHAPSNANAQRLISNAVTWAGGLGHNSAGGYTGMYLSFGCSLLAGIDLANLFTPTFGTPLTSNGTPNADAVTVTAAGTASGLLTGIDTPASLAFGNFAHGSITSFPAAFQSLVLSGPSPENTIITREMTCM
jgi:hypothetical protein